MNANLSAFLGQFLRVSLMALVPVVAAAFFTTQTTFSHRDASTISCTAPAVRHMT